MLALASFATATWANDVTDLMTEAQRDYVRNDFKSAKEKFEMVRTLDPNNKTAIAYLRRIVVDEKAQTAGQPPRNSTQEALQKLILEKVDFREASLPETLDFLRQKGNQLSGGKVAINFVLQLDEATQAAKITVALQRVPFAEVLRYIGDLVGAQFVYEPYAIVVKPKGAAPAVPTGVPAAPAAPKIPGL